MGGGERVDIRANIERKKVRTVLYVGSIGRDARGPLWDGMGWG